MRPSIPLLPFVFLASLAGAALGAEPTPLGQWELSTGESRYTVSACGDTLCARLVWLREDARTPENLALLDSYVVRGAVPADDGKWTATVTYDGTDYVGTMVLTEPDEMQLRSCSGILCRSFTLRRI